MKNMLKIMVGITGVSAAGIITYSIMNKKVRNKMMDLKDTMIEEALDMEKKHK